MSAAVRIMEWLEILGGARPLPSALEGRPAVAILRGAWWLLLLVLAWAFAGRATKFVYVDF
jgi:hypothetical protein